jgi:hypothetical protein
MVVRLSRTAAAVAVVAVVAFAAQSARAAPGMVVGVSDDIFKIEGGGSYAADLGLGAVRVTLRWHDGATTVAPTDLADLDRAVATGSRVVVSVYGPWQEAPQTDEERDSYCGYVRDMLEHEPQIRDVVIWNEPNLSIFWRSQFDGGGVPASPAAYEALLARCWDVLHAARPDVNVIAPALCPWGSDSPTGPLTISNSPGAFIRELGAAYRATGRTAPIFDTVGHHIYGDSPGERPWRTHPYSKRIAEGDLDKLVTALQQGFAGTAQAVPGRPAGARTVDVWYMEAGYETVPDPEKAFGYFGRETTSGVLPDALPDPPWTLPPPAESTAPDQATQLRDAVRLAYCQPYVGAFFNFLLRDENDLGQWQSGVLWADRTPKGSYAAFRDVIREVAANAVDCSRYPATSLPPAPAPPAPAGPPAPAATPPLLPTLARTQPAAPRLHVRWVRVPNRSYRPRRVVRLAVRANRRASFLATLVGRDGERTLAVRGVLRAKRTSVIRFPRARLPHGVYRAVVHAGGRPRLRSRPFAVR